MVMEQEPVVNDTPNYHGMFMVGLDKIFACHMPMFTKECHMYQMILEISLPDDVTKAYIEGRKENPSNVYNLINSDGHPFTLPSVAIGEVTNYPADIYANYSNEGDGSPEDKIFSGVTLMVKRVVYFRHFDFNFNYPENMTYILFGSAEEAHMSHYITRDPDFQHILSLEIPPPWLASDQLQAGVTINIETIKSVPIPCSNPLPDEKYSVYFAGEQDNVQEIFLGKHATIWFSTGNLLNAKDPC